MASFDGFAEITLANWRDFKADLYGMIESIQAAALPAGTTASVDPKKFVFRGQGCKSWNLETSFDRRFRIHHTTGSIDIDGEYNAVFAEFLEDCKYYGIQDEVPNSLADKPNDFLEEKGQHYGLPTRLLDWSSSPYVAAFFGFSDERKCTSGYISIWALDVQETQRCWKPQDLNIIKNPSSNNPRMRMQLGLFTRNMSNLIALEDLFKFANHRYRVMPRYPVLFKFNIPIAESDTAIADLDRMGIDFIKLFPGIEGLCKQYEYTVWNKTK
jgi:hypothetical protein